MALLGQVTGSATASTTLVGKNGEYFVHNSASTNNLTLVNAESPSSAVEYSILSVISPGNLVAGSFYTSGPFSPLDISIVTGPVLRTRVRINNGDYLYSEMALPPVAGAVYNCVASVSFLRNELALHVNGEEYITSLGGASGWYNTGKPSQNITQIGYAGASPVRRVAMISTSMMYDPITARALSENPWQLFKSEPTRIYSFPSGPISISWSSLTASNIAQTGARLTLGGIVR